MWCVGCLAFSTRFPAVLRPILGLKVVSCSNSPSIWGLVGDKLRFGCWLGWGMRWFGLSGVPVATKWCYQMVLSQAGFLRKLGGLGLKFGSTKDDPSRVLWRHHARALDTDGLRTCRADAARLWVAGWPRTAAPGPGLPDGQHYRPVGGSGGSVVSMSMAEQHAAEADSCARSESKMRRCVDSSEAE